MPDDQTPQASPDPQAASAPEAAIEPAGKPSGATEPAGAPSGATQAADEPSDATEQASEPTSEPRRRAVWAAVAVACFLAGTVGSVLGARAVARNDSATTRTAFHQSSAAIATTLKLAIQRQEELTVAASTFFASNPKASPAEFARWVKWARTLRRYPELDALGLLRLPDTSPALLLSRDTGLSTYNAVSAGGRQVLTVETPVYRGNVTPRSVFGRTAASVGWLREVLIPGAVLRQTLVGHPGYALQLTYRNGSANLVFAAGSPQSSAQSATIGLHDGWTVTSFGPAANASILNDGDALALLIGGILGSALLGLLVFVLGAARPAAPAPVEAEAQTEAEAALPDKYLYEPITGLPNRELTLDRAERMVARAGRDSGMLAGALFVDIDQLSEVNEKLGRTAGNQLLKIVGERLLDVVRAGDTVGRLDGEEFVVLVESAARGVRLDSLAQRMIEALHKPIELDDFGPSFVLTASIGVAFGRYATPDDLLRDAHVALTSAKAAGKDRYTLFNANMRTVIEGRAVLEAELNTALAEQQFFLLYQPIYDLRTRRVTGLEAQIRWRHPEQGVLAPDVFIPLAEETGLIVPIGRYMLEAACIRAAAWDVAGRAVERTTVDPPVYAGGHVGADGRVIAGGHASADGYATTDGPASADRHLGARGRIDVSGRVGVSVKVSAHQLGRDGFTTDVRRALQQSGIEPSLLTLEIPETAVMRDLTTAAERLRELKALGVSIAIDNFGGSGYAHQADLRQLPLDSLRVDRSSLAASEDENYRNWLLEAILLVGRDLELTVIATGIETHEQMATLQTLGCTMAQGALLGTPTPAEAIESLFRAELPLPVAAVPSPSLSS